MSGKPDVLLVGHKKPTIVNGLANAVTLHALIDAKDPDAFLAPLTDKISGIAVAYTAYKIDAALMQRLPKLKMISSFGVGYDHVDAKWAGAHGITVTNTPDVLNEEVADTALGLLLMTARELPQGERYLRAGKWPQGGYRLSPATMRDRTVGIVGMGRIGRAIGKRLEAFGVPVVYHSRNPQQGVTYTYYPKLLDMARDVDTLMLIVPGGAATKNMINAEVLKALGPNGIVINMARGSVIDEPALIDALKNNTIMSAGLDVFVNEPHVPAELMAMENVVLLPHLGSASVHTRRAMDQLVVDNLLAYFAGKPPLTPVPETPWPPKQG
ncbi:MAG: 2-hydroxyacid dehydrogenase [Rhizobiales bacterium]|nr:2-hydroxyacid dehydrogenase [Hyphomicrobiales bacterium]OJY43352.1 MAG: 2-hydroxyacid dehydrogenase [Rhizobiales bacterium 64-17]